MLRRRYAAEIVPAACAGWTLQRNTTRIIRFDFETKNDFLFFKVFYRLNNITVSCFAECGVMTCVQSVLYGETLYFFLVNYLPIALHFPS